MRSDAVSGLTSHKCTITAFLRILCQVLLTHSKQKLQNLEADLYYRGRALVLLIFSNIFSSVTSCTIFFKLHNLVAQFSFYINIVRLRGHGMRLRPHVQRQSSMFYFPHKQPDRLSMWLKNVPRSDFKPTKHFRIWEIHFETRFIVREDELIRPDVLQFLQLAVLKSAFRVAQKYSSTWF